MKVEMRPACVTIEHHVSDGTIHMASRSDDGKFKFACGVRTVHAGYVPLVLMTVNDEICPQCRASFDAYKRDSREKYATITVMGDCVIVRRANRHRYYYPAQMSGASCRRLLNLLEKCQPDLWPNRYHWIA